MSSKSAAELTEAQSEETSPDRLSEIWNTSRSVKVRKAVASNPNADPLVLRQAARLYLDEVVENPGFEMLQLFDTGDQWVKDIASAYHDPTEFLSTRGAYYWSRGGTECYLKACLLSKKLDGWTLNRVVDNIPATGLRRAIKNPSVRERIRSIFVKELKEGSCSWPLDLGCVIRLYLENVINNDELKLALTNYGVGSCSARKTTYSGFVARLQQQYQDAKTQEEKNLFIELVGRTTIISRSYTLNWIHRGLDRESLLAWSGELYSKIFKMIADNCRHRSLIQDNIAWVGRIVTAYVKAKLLTGEEGERVYSKSDLENVYEFAREYNLVNEPFSQFGLTLHGNGGHEELVKCNIETKEFFLRAGCVGSWASTSGKDPRYLIAEEVNNHIYERDGIGSTLLFNKCSVRKIVTLDDSTHIY